MPYSMTAFAHLEQSTPIGMVECRLSTLNSRYLDLHIHLADPFHTLEGSVRKLLSKRLKRGRVECSVRLMHGTESSELVINHDLVRHILSASHQIALQAEHEVTINPVHILRWPGVIQSSKPDQSSVNSVVLPVVEQTVETLVNSRQREGSALAVCLMECCDAISKITVSLRQQLPNILGRQRERFQQRLKTLLGEDAFPVNELRMEQEFAILVQKSGVAEEMDRLDTHLLEVRRLLKEDTAIGRQLEFLVQELNREANTLGAKSNTIETDLMAIDLKVLIDQLREQLQNIE